MASKPTILVVDDEPHIRYMLQFKLSDAGYNVVTANNGQEAYELACEVHPHVVVTDLQMPGASGLHMCKQLAVNPQTRRIPVLMLTARGHRIPPDELARTNIKCLLAKPFSPRELLKRVSELMEMAETTPQGTRSDPGANAA